jgi:hypothetical protein
VALYCHSSIRLHGILFLLLLIECLVSLMDPCSVSICVGCVAFNFNDIAASLFVSNNSRSIRILKGNPVYVYLVGPAPILGYSLGEM